MFHSGGIYSFLNRKEVNVLPNLKHYVENIIKDTVLDSPHSEYFIEPIIGFASADDPLYDKLDEIIGHPQVHPKQFLDSAKTVIVYFLPFSRETVKTVQGDKVISNAWSQTYTYGNEILSQISLNLKEKLGQEDVIVRSDPPTYTKATYDSINLSSKWAHKSSAVIAGVGTFGLNHLIITKKGTTGRLGSVVIDAYIEPTKRATVSNCLFYSTGKCKVCVEKCPSGALSVDGSFDRFRCNAYLDGKNISDFEQGCGMCSSGPCATRGFGNEVNIPTSNMKSQSTIQSTGKKIPKKHQSSSIATANIFIGSKITMRQSNGIEKLSTPISSLRVIRTWTCISKTKDSDLDENYSSDLKSAIFDHYYHNSKEAEDFYRLGMLYLRGWGVDQNDNKAAEAFEIAATRDNGGALYQMAIFHLDGKVSIPKGLP